MASTARGGGASVRPVTFAVRAASALDYPVFARLFPELGVSDPLPTEEQFATRMLPRVSVLDETGDALGYAFHQVYGSTTHVVHVEHVNVFVEGNRQLFEQLRDVGADLQHALYRMGATLG